MLTGAYGVLATSLPEVQMVLLYCQIPMLAGLDMPASVLWTVV